MPDWYDLIRYGKLTPLEEARKLLAQHGVSLDQLELPHLVATRKSAGEYRGKEFVQRRFEPTQTNAYFRGLMVEETGDKVVVKGQYFQQDSADHRAHGEWVPGPLKTAPIKTVVKKKGKTGK